MTERSPLGQRLAFLRGRRRWTQRELAERIGVSSGTISNWELGVSNIPSPDLPAVAAALGVTVADLFEPEPAKTSPAFNATPPVEPRAAGVSPRPIYRWGSLGDPRSRDSSPHPDREEYPPAGREYLIGPNGFGVDVRGTSMVGRNLHDGDVCWINPERDYRMGDLVLALLTAADGDSGMVVKTYTRTEDGDRLQSETETGRALVECAEFKIIGPVVWIQRGFPPR